MARRVFLHVGTPKTGTTFLQSVMWANKAILAEQDILLPMRGLINHYEASVMVRGEQPAIERLPRAGRNSWRTILNQISRHDGTAIVSHELFAPVDAEHAARALQQLREVADDVHVVITARDLVRQAPAEWQEETKHGAKLTIRQFFKRLQREDPNDWFWRVQDLADIASRWSQGIGAANVHIVTVPPPGAPKGALWERFAGLVGIDPDSCDLAVSKGNKSLGAAEVEFMRRCNQYLPGNLPPGQLPALWRALLAEEILAPRESAQRFAPPQDMHPWVVQRSEQMLAELDAGGYDVVGSLDELRPSTEPPQGVDPDTVSDSDVLAVAVQAMPQLTFHPRIGGARLKVAEQAKKIQGLNRRLDEERRGSPFGAVYRAKAATRAQAGRVKRGLKRRLSR